MPTKKPFSSNPASNNGDAQSEAENASRVLYNIVEDEDLTAADAPREAPNGNAARPASASSPQPPAAPPPAQPTPPAAVSGSSNGGMGKLVLQSVVSGVVMGIVGAIFGHTPDVDIFN